MLHVVLSVVVVDAGHTLRHVRTLGIECVVDNLVSEELVHFLQGFAAMQLANRSGNLEWRNSPFSFWEEQKHHEEREDVQAHEEQVVLPGGVIETYMRMN